MSHAHRFTFCIGSSRTVKDNIIALAIVSLLVLTGISFRSVAADAPPARPVMLGEFSDPDCTGCAMSLPVRMGDKIYFSANDGQGWDLWVSDGTHTGTHIFYNLSDNATVEFYGLVVNQKFLFTVHSAGLVQLYASDGTAAGTGPIAQVAGDHFKYYQGLAYFIVTPGSNAQLWKSDGTSAGTQLIKELDGPGGMIVPPYLISTPPAGGSILWYTNGTGSGTIPLLQSEGLSYNAMLVPLTASRMVFFTPTFDCTTAQDVELWVSDNTPIGTQKIATFPNTCYPGINRKINGQLFFTIEEADASGEYLWQTDGTGSGTLKVDDRFKFEQVAHPYTYNSRLYFVASMAGSSFVYSTQGNAAGGIQEINASTLGVEAANFEYTPFNSLVYYMDVDAGQETLFHTDGVTASSIGFPADHFTGAADLRTSPSGYMVFGATSEDGTWKVYASDGTPVGTRVLFAPDVSDLANQQARYFFETARATFFVSGADSSHTVRLWALSEQPNQVYLPAIVR